MKRIVLRGLEIASVTKVRHNVFPEVEEHRHSSTRSEENIVDKVDRSRC